MAMYIDSPHIPNNNSPTILALEVGKKERFEEHLSFIARRTGCGIMLIPAGFTTNNDGMVANAVYVELQRYWLN